MAIDLDKIKQKLQRLESRGGNNGPSIKDFIWKPEPGTTRIRIVPYIHDSSTPFQELKFHYNIGKRPYLSPLTVGEADPIAELAEQVRAKGSKDAEDMEMLKTLTPSTRTYLPIVVRGQEGEGVKFWGFGKTVAVDLMSYFVDPDYGDLSDPENGRDIDVEFLTKEQTGTQFPGTRTKVKPNISALSTSEDVLKKLSDQPKLVGELFTVPTYEELETVLNEWLEGDSAKSKEEEESTDDLPWDKNGNDKQASIAAQFANLTGK